MMKKKALSLALALAACLSLTVPALGAEAPHDVDVTSIPATWEHWGDRLPDDVKLTINGVTGQETYEDTILFDVVPGGGYTLDMSYPVGKYRFYSTYLMYVCLNGEFLEDPDPYLPSVINGYGDTSEPLDQYVFTCTENMVSTPGTELLYCFWLDWDEGEPDAEYSDLGGNVNFWLRVRPAPAGAQAAPTNDRLTADGEVQDPTVYKINGNNYFKIRDLAAILNGTEKQFEVGYDGASKSVTATSGKPYAPAGGELAGAAADSQTAAVSNDKIIINGVPTNVEVYKIAGSNYFKLRDLGKALDFYVGYEKGKGMFIETDKPYSE